MLINELLTEDLRILENLRKWYDEQYSKGKAELVTKQNATPNHKSINERLIPYSLHGRIMR